MKTFSKWFDHYLRWQEHFCNTMLIALGLAMTLLILLQVFFRFVVYVPFPWSEECARYLMIWMGMLGSALALQKGRHIGVTMVMEKLPEKWHKAMTLFVQLATIGFLSVLFYQGIQFALFNQGQSSPALEISMLVPYLSLPVGSAMMILVIAGDILHTFFPANTVLG
ncbi:TRAP transporter small permease [Desulforapulum autotrophicum]|nr:TRAP transporter small permease [Desulforapulum autotrophicum]